MADQPAVEGVNPKPPLVTIDDSATSRAALRLSRHMAYHSAMIRYLKLALALGLLVAACSGRPGPITVEDNVVTVQNQTNRDWRNVVVTVNDHFRGGTPTLAAGSHMRAPLSQFQTAFGQHYDMARQHVTKIVVTATDANGEPVEITFDPLKR